ncbi:MAG TPA: outer membrane lipoprotein-sorting protein [Cyclobacteriaceae bacterium]|nr:outer membrane lipoprotein-sorting protein [Cyclobacteriaceae bacterium]
MKKTLLIAGMFCLAFITAAQSVDEIINQYLENTGGASKWAQLKGLRYQGKVNVQGMDLPVEMAQLKSGKMYMKFELQGTEVVQQAFDGNVAWGTNFMIMKAEKSDHETTENMKREMQDFPDPFLDYKNKGYKAELLGKESVEGTECYKIRLTKKPLLADGKEVDNVIFYYFDTDNMVPIMSEQEIKSGPAKGMVSQSLFSDYQEVNGLYFPFSLTQKAKGQPMGQTINFTKIELNPTIDDSAFAFKDSDN